MPASNVIAFTRNRFPAYAEAEFQVVPLDKGGSDRKFYRIQAADGSTLVVVKYDVKRLENRRYAEIASFLDQAGVPVPHVHFHDPDEGLIWMQDLGEIDLWHHRNEAWDVRRCLYQDALRAVNLMHTQATRAFETAKIGVELEFDEQLYLWEQHYFFEHCLRGVFGMDADEVARYAALPGLADIAPRLAALPRVLVHRDFQSQNIMVNAGRSWLIDFQGMRPGLAEYDAASLLYDPYVSLAESEREELLGYFEALTERGQAFRETFYLCALQRLMQALGAYGFLAMQKEKRRFLEHIPSAKSNLRVVASRIDGLDSFVELLDSL